MFLLSLTKNYQFEVLFCNFELEFDKCTFRSDYTFFFSGMPVGENAIQRTMTVFVRTFAPRGRYSTTCLSLPSSNSYWRTSTPRIKFYFIYSVLLFHKWIIVMIAYVDKKCLLKVIFPKIVLF